MPAQRSAIKRADGYGFPGELLLEPAPRTGFARAKGSVEFVRVRWALPLGRRACSPGGIFLAAPAGARRCASGRFRVSSLSRKRRPVSCSGPVCGDAGRMGSTRLSVTVGGKRRAGFDLAGGGEPAGEQILGGGGAAAPSFSGLERAAAAGRAPFEHPARQQGERGFFHHFIEQNHEFAAEIGRVLQLAHLKIAQGSIRTLAKVLNRRTSEPCHVSSPGVRWVADGPVLPGTVADSHISTQPFLPVVNPAGGTQRNGSGIALRPAFPGGTEKRNSMCSGCSGDPEEPPESLPAPTAAMDDPFWAWWKQPPEDEEDADAGGDTAEALRRAGTGDAPAAPPPGEVA